MESNLIVKFTEIVKKSKNPLGFKQINQYQIIKLLGEGSSCKVKLVLNIENNEKYALKCFNKSLLKKRTKLIKTADGKPSYKTALQDVYREIEIMKKLDHKNIIKLFEIIDQKDGNGLYMVLEYAEMGEALIWDEEKTVFSQNLTKKSKYLDESFIRQIIRDSLKGLNYLHKKGILHRDIKPLNILLTEDFTAKLSDFGVSIELESADNDKMKGSEGTYHFMAPESLKSEGNEDGYSGKMADLWALGITLYCLTYLKLPFFDNSILILIQNIGNKEVEFFKSRTISEDLRNLISKMLEKNVKNRLNFDELTKNSWINKDCQNLYDELI